MILGDTQCFIYIIVSKEVIIIILNYERNYKGITMNT